MLITEQQGGTLTTVSRRRTRLGDTRAIEMFFRQEIEGVVGLSRRVFTEVDGVIYGFTYLSQERQLRTHMKTFATMIVSFEVE